MCGISAIVSRDGIPTKSLVSMNNLIRHRGPDDEGYWLLNGSNSNNYYFGDDTPHNVTDYYSDKFSGHISEVLTSNCKVGLGHRRLSIIDLSPTGHMPMSSNDERYIMVYNGEIYNYIELKIELEKVGFNFSSDSDSEVVICAFSHWRELAFSKFKGMWAIVIFDKVTSEMFACRDRYGIKPLYYYLSNKGDYYFSSEIKQLLNVDQSNFKLNKKLAMDYMLYSLTDHTGETMFDGIKSIKPGELVILKFKSECIELNSVQWYDVNRLQSNETFNLDVYDQFKIKLYEAVSQHLRSDVPLGFMASGGMDSTSILYIANDILNGNYSSARNMLETFSAVSGPKEYNESYWINQSLDRSVMIPHFSSLSGDSVLNNVYDYISVQEEPYQSQSAYLGFKLYELAKKYNIKVVLNGQGADEYMNGYGSIWTYYYKRHFLKLLSKSNLSYRAKLGYIIKIIKQLLLNEIKIPRPNHYQRLHQLGWNNLFNEEFLNSRYGSHPYDLIGYYPRSFLDDAKFQLLVNPLPRYLRWEDRNSMANSIESRVPFLDHELIELVLSYNMENLVSNDSPKPLLFHSLRGVIPEVIRKRKDKKGFVTPEEHWVKSGDVKQFNHFIKQSLAGMESIFNVDSAVKILSFYRTGILPFDYSYWRILCFSIWAKKFGLV